jgi:hypothetical protein
VVRSTPADLTSRSSTTRSGRLDTIEIVKPVGDLGVELPADVIGVDRPAP